MIKVLVAGDFCPQCRISSLFENANYDQVLSEVKPIIEKADYSIINLECPVTKGIEKPIEKKGPNLQCSEKGVEAIKWAGFDSVTLANNHFLDYGENGVKNTLEVCNKFGIDTVGGGNSLKEASTILYRDIENQTLAIINCCEHEFSIATETSAGSNPLNPIQQYYAILEAKKNADYVLVIVHGGHEYYQLPSPRMQESYRFFIDSGADAVVNHHQHCFSGYEVYKGKPIFYGLGNFCFDEGVGNKESWYEGYMVELGLSQNAIDYKIYPYKQCTEEAKVSMLANGYYDKKIINLNKIITDNEKLRESTEKYFKSCMLTASSVFEPTENRIVLGLQRRGWIPSFLSKRQWLKLQNYILCESHRDKLAFFLNKKYGKY